MRVARFAGRECGEFGGHGFTDDDATKMPCQCNHRRIGGRAMALVHRGAVFGWHVECIENVFNADRQPVQRSLNGAGIQHACLRDHLSCIEISECLHQGLAFGDALQAGAGIGFGRQTAF